MKYTVIDIAQAKAHGIMLVPSMRQSVDGTKIVLHEEYIHNIDEFKTLPRYEYDSEEFMKLMNSKAWVHDKDYIIPDENYSRILAIREMNKEVETNINTASLWKEVNVTHSGTKEDPIPYNIIYLCTRDTSI